MFGLTPLGTFHTVVSLIAVAAGLASLIGHGIITWVVLGVALIAGGTKVFGRASRYIETIAYSLTLFFHMVPGVTETATRIPLGAPFAAGPDDPIVRGGIGI